MHSNDLRTENPSWESFNKPLGQKINCIVREKLWRIWVESPEPRPEFSGNLVDIVVRESTSEALQDCLKLEAEPGPQPLRRLLEGAGVLKEGRLSVSTGSAIPDEIVDGWIAEIEKATPAYAFLDALADYPEALEIVMASYAASKALKEGGVDAIHGRVHELLESEDPLIPHYDASMLYSVMLFPKIVRDMVGRVLVAKCNISYLQERMCMLDRDSIEFVDMLIEYQKGRVWADQWPELVANFPASDETIGQIRSAYGQADELLSFIKTQVGDGRKRHVLEDFEDFTNYRSERVNELRGRYGSALECTDPGQCFKFDPNLARCLR